jgi:hypothetical protein
MTALLDGLLVVDRPQPRAGRPARGDRHSGSSRQEFAGAGWIPSAGQAKRRGQCAGVPQI